nr:MMPL family transporter [Acidimicrobiia bacterium]
QELAAQYLLLYEMSLPYGLDINNQIDQGKTGTRLNLILGGLTSGDVVGLQQNIREWFSENAPKLQVIPTGMLPLMSDMTYVHMIPNMMKGGIIAVLMVSLVLFLALHSWRLGLLGMLANIVPITMGFGLWAVYYGMANFAVMSVAGICLGVVVDFAVHFLNKYQKGYKENQQVEAGVRYAFEKVSFPLVTTMLVLVSGFWVLATSPFQLIGHLGLLAGIIILLALAVNLLFLPAVLLTFEKHVRAP